MIRPPSARIGPITPAERAAIMAKSPVKGKYDTTIDRESAYEMLGKRVAREAAPADQAEQGSGGGIGDWIGGIFGTNRKRGETLTTGQHGRRRRADRDRRPSSAVSQLQSASRSADAPAPRSAARSCATRWAGFCGDNSRHPEARAKLASKDTGRRPSRPIAAQSHLRVTVQSME